MSKILVVDDQRNMRTTLALLLQNANFNVEVAQSAEEAFRLIESDVFDVVVTDLRLGDLDGIEVLRFVKEHSPLTEVIVMTAYATVQSAVDAMKIGAHDYIQKPFTEEELIVKVQKALEKRQLTGEVSAMAGEFRSRYRLEEIIGGSAIVRDVLARLIRIAPTDATVLITGESGTGKELMARAIHANSLRANKPFVPINCAAMADTLLESELFGHVRGAFTGAAVSRKGLFEEADGGTFFFDEIAETSPSFQAKLLRALQEGEIRRLGDNRQVSVNVRVVAATNQDLKLAIAERRFREDLYYRLNVVRFKIPPLRERRDDIPGLVQHFMRKHSRPGITLRLADGVMDYLVSYRFPGNIRELENILEQGIALAVNGVVRLEDIRVMDQNETVDFPTAATTGLTDHVDRVEREAILAALGQSGGRKQKAAQLLGLSVTTLWRKMKRLGMD